MSEHEFTLTAHEAWCARCGTVSTDGTCHCTEDSVPPGKPDWQPHDRKAMKTIAELRARLAQATCFHIGRTKHGDRIDVVRREQRDGTGAWAVSNDVGEVLNSKSLWEYEPRPSNRDDDFIARTRFPLEKAFELAEAKVAGDPVDEFFDQIEADIARELSNK